jgi:N-glycosylase/DNA lyase
VKRLPLSALNELRNLHADSKDRIRERLAEFRAVPESRYFYELCYCLLTPQSSAAHCMSVMRQLEALDFEHRDFDPEPYLHPGPPVYVRFHRVKARRLAALKRSMPEVRRLFVESLSTLELRDCLVSAVNGIGYKEASHFLRNIGRTDVVIVDRHIIRNFVRLGIIDQPSKSFTRKKYMEIEKLFFEFSEVCGIPADELDLVLWSRETGVVLK